MASHYMSELHFWELRFLIPFGNSKGSAMGSQDRAVAYLSASTPVNMGDWWFDIATSNHFWIRRRFEVMMRLADSAIRNSKRAAEIGCGNGLLQRDIEDYYGIPVAGFELNEVALQKNVSLCARIIP